ncbi:serine hydrolase domain-containing protein [Longimicrobium sp.]|uniref:serine hydrolase domain-containing protein n=1 Tax=Longimicrobium sp. TaxID=2029185 RepID=UPI003B3BA40C
MARSPSRFSSSVLIVCAAVLLAPRPASGQASSASSAPAIAWVDTVFKDLGPDGPGCAAAASRHGQPLFARAYGLAQLDERRAASPSTVYRIGSVAKQFTAMSVVLLAQDGRLSLDDDVRRWIPELPDYGHTITLRQLLTHTSGLRDYLSILYMQRGGGRRVTTRDAMETIVRQRELNFVPGTDWAYSNSGYFLLGQVVERVSGRTLPEFVRDRILAPVGMNSTTFPEDLSQASRRAAGYDYADSVWTQSTEPVLALGSGGMYSTVEDLLRWAEALAAGRVGGMEAMRMMETPATLADGSEVMYGLGLELGEYRGLRAVSHTGAGEGFRAALVTFPAQRLSIAVLCNGATAEAAMRARHLSDGLLGTELAAAEAPAPAAPAPPASAVDDGDLARFAGVYVSASTLMRTFVVDSGALRVQVAPGVLRPLEPLGGGRFRVVSTETTYRFGPGTVRRESAGVAPVEFHYAGPAGDTAADPARYAGRYESPEMGVTWELRAGDDGTLRVVHGGPGSPEKADKVFRDGFTFSYGLIRFVTDCRGEVAGFTLGDDRVYALRFNRVGQGGASAACPPPARPEPAAERKEPPRGHPPAAEDSHTRAETEDPRWKLPGQRHRADTKSESCAARSAHPTFAPHHG